MARMATPTPATAQSTPALPSQVTALTTVTSAPFPATRSLIPVAAPWSSDSSGAQRSRTRTSRTAKTAAAMVTAASGTSGRRGRFRRVTDMTGTLPTAEAFIPERPGTGCPARQDGPRFRPGPEPPPSDVGPDEAAVDLVDGAGDVGGLLRGQERDEVAEFDRLPEAAERDDRGDRRELLLEGLVLLGAAARAGDDARGEEHARQHQVDRDAVLGQVGHDRLHQPRHARAEPVRHVDPVDRLLHRHRLDPDDAAPLPGAHVGHYLADEADEVQRDHLERLPPVRVGEVRELAARRAAGVVDQDVHPAETLGRGRDHGADAVLAGQVGRDGEHLGAGLATDLPGRGRQVCLGPRADRDPGTLAGQGQRGRLAQALARRGDERDLAVPTADGGAGAAGGPRTGGPRDASDPAQDADDPAQDGRLVAADRRVDGVVR